MFSFSSLMFLINIHKNQLRKKKERQSRRRLSTKRLLTESTMDSSCGGGGGRLTSHSTGSCSGNEGQKPYSMVLAANNSSSSGVYSELPLDGGGGDLAELDVVVGGHGSVVASAGGVFGCPEDVLDLEKQELEEEEEESDYSDEGIAGIDIPENILLEDLVFADNITSCNKVGKLLE